MPAPAHIASPNALHINTSPADTLPLQRTSQTGTLSSLARRISARLDTRQPHRWPRIIQRALAASPKTERAGIARAAMPTLHAYLDEYDRIVKDMPALPTSRLSKLLMQDFLQCRDALQLVVDCREAADKLQAAHASSKDIAEARLKLTVASTRAALMISQVRHTVSIQKTTERVLDFLRAGLAALWVASTIVGLAFPPALGLCLGITIAASSQWMGCTIAKIFFSDPVNRPTFRAIDRWLEHQPPELVAGEKNARNLAAMLSGERKPIAAAGNLTTAVDMALKSQ